MSSHTKVSFAVNQNNGDYSGSPSKRSSSAAMNPDSNSSTAMIYHLGGMCIRDYQLALQRSVNELKSREQQVNSLYSSLIDREETIARLTRENESLKQRLKHQSEMASTQGVVRTSSSCGTIISTHELAGELHQTIPTPLPLMHSSHTTDSPASVLTKARRDRLRAALAKNDLLGRLDFEQADELISRMAEQRVALGDVIIKEGEAGTVLYVMEDGEVDIYRQGQFLCRLIAPFVFGELAVIYNCPRSATIVAATNCRIWSIENKAFQKCMTRIRQRTINKVAAELKNISIFSLLSKTTLAAIVDAGEELHFSPGSHVTIEPGTLYILTVGSLSSGSLFCSCGNTDGHRSEPAYETCRRRIIEIKATACFCSQLPKKFFEVLASIPTAATAVKSDIYNLSAHDIAMLKASDGNATRVSCFRLDTNFVLRAIEHKDEEPLSPGFSKESKAKAPQNALENVLDVSDLSIAAVLPNRDTHSHMFCVFDLKVPRRNAVVTSSTDDEDTTEKATANDGDDNNTNNGAPEASPSGFRRSACYILRWVLRQRAEMAGMTERLNYERQHLLTCRPCDFIVQLVATLQDPTSVYFIYETCLGGTLESLLRTCSAGGGPSTPSGVNSPTTTFSFMSSIRRSNRNSSTYNSSGGASGRGSAGIEEEWARFYLACMIEALDFLHENGIVHRNVCPASIYLTPRGYAKLGDFTWTKSIGARSRTFSLCGPVERLAPEVMLNKGHGLAADRWALGILLYEMIVGKPPFLRDDPMLTCTAILQHAGSATASTMATSENADTFDFPRRVSKPVRDAVRRLCRPCPADRIAFDALRQHAYFIAGCNSTFDWQSLRELRMTPPFIPNVVSSTDLTNITGARRLVNSIPVASLVSSCNNNANSYNNNNNNNNNNSNKNELSSTLGDDPFQFEPTTAAAVGDGERLTITVDSHNNKS